VTPVFFLQLLHRAGGKIRQMRDKLLKLRDELQRLSATGDEAAVVVELDQSKVGRLSRMDAMRAQAMAQATANRRALKLRSIQAALERVDAGEYGRCQSCDKEIPAKRLEIDPTVLYCIRCASEQEQSSS
jgi:DnaK suppressor protein